MNYSTLSIMNRVKSRNFSTLSIMIRVKSRNFSTLSIMNRVKSMNLSTLSIMIHVKSMNFSTLSIINHVKRMNFSTLSIMIRVKSIMNSSLVYEIAWGFSSLSASIFSTPEYCGNTLEDIERKMDQTSGLCEYRLAFLHNQQSVGCHWKYTVH